MGDTEEITASLVREYLSRKGLKNTLKTLDDELPRTSSSISNRAQLAKEIHIERLMKKNKESEETSFRTMLEVMVKYMRDRDRHPSSDGPSVSKMGLTRPSSRKGHRENALEKNDLKSSLNHMAEKEKVISGKSRIGSDVDFLSKKKVDNGDLIISPTAKKFNEQDFFISSPNNEKETNFFPTSNVGRSVNRIDSTLSKSVELPRNENIILNSDIATKPTVKRNRGRLGVGSSGPVMSSGLGGMKEGRGHPRRKQHLSNPDLTKSTLLSMDDDIKMNVEGTNPSRKSSRGEVNRDGQADEKTNDKLVNNEIPETSFETQKSTPSFLQPTRQTLKSSAEDLVFEDIDDDLGQELANISLGVPRDTLTADFTREDVTLDIAKDLKNLIFGVTSASFSPEWSKQGFAFTDAPGLEYGIVQHKGGPCGILASVQATVLKHLMLETKTRGESKSLQPSLAERNNALALCLSEMLWRCGESKKAVVVLPSMGTKFIGGARYKADGITESLTVYSFKTQESLLLFTRQNLSQFQNGCGVILLLYSAILSRTVPRVKSDMDEPSGKLLGAHGYCTQEMVNLLLTGKAHSNVFDNTIKLEPNLTLRGLQKQNDIGLLSLFEHYRSCEVGSFYKTPKFPIWVVCSESHFSVLFATSVNFLSDRRLQRRFDLFYFDGLARQDEEIRLTVDTTRSPDYTEGELVPPLELCIRTKWTNASVDWNGSDPIL